MEAATCKIVRNSIICHHTHTHPTPCPIRHTKTLCPFHPVTVYEICAACTAIFASAGITKIDAERLYLAFALKENYHGPIGVLLENGTSVLSREPKTAAKKTKTKTKSARRLSIEIPSAGDLSEPNITYWREIMELRTILQVAASIFVVCVVS